MSISLCVHLDSKSFKVEIKNMNSFNAIQRAIDYEIERQIAALEAGERIVMETRLWEEGSQRTISMRSKEGSSATAISQNRTWFD